jgi:hypothetical protein
MRLSAPAASCFSTAAVPPLRLRVVEGGAVRPRRPARPRRAAAGGRHGGAVGVPLALAGLLFGVAVLVAPEQPVAQEAICHRHNGEAACRVW